jgi:hypothetical protein
MNLVKYPLTDNLLLEANLTSIVLDIHKNRLQKSKDKIVLRNIFRNLWMKSQLECLRELSIKGQVSMN